MVKRITLIKKARRRVSELFVKSPSTPARSSLRSGTRSAEDVACLSFYFINVTAKRRITLIKKARRRPTLPLNAVPSALKGLTSVFDMGTGGSPSLRSPGNNYYRLRSDRFYPLWSSVRLPFGKLCCVSFDCRTQRPLFLGPAKEWSTQ